MAYAIRDATDGSPLQILETLKLLIEQSLLVRVQGTWTVDDSDALFEALAQGSALQRRVESLEPVAGSVLLVLALGVAAVDFASAAVLERAAGAFGQALLSRAGQDMQKLFAAASLIARAGDDQRFPLSKAFERFVRPRRTHHPNVPRLVNRPQHRVTEFREKR